MSDQAKIFRLSKIRGNNQMFNSCINAATHNFKLGLARQNQLSLDLGVANLRVAIKSIEQSNCRLSPSQIQYILDCIDYFGAYKVANDE